MARRPASALVQPFTTTTTSSRLQMNKSTQPQRMLRLCPQSDCRPDRGVVSRARSILFATARVSDLVGSANLWLRCHLSEAFSASERAL